MTTLVGICSEDKSEVVLAADRQASNTDNEGKFVYKQAAQKLYVNKDRNIALGIVGAYDESTKTLVKQIVDGNLDIQKITSDGRFQQLFEINLNRAKGRMLTPDNSTGMLIATRFNSPELFTCFPMGSVEPRMNICVGSGEKYASEYFNAESIMSQARPEASIFESKKLTPKVARELAYRAVRFAGKFDPYSNGLDMLTLSGEGIKEFGEEITKQEDLAQENIARILGIRHNL